MREADAGGKPFDRLALNRWRLSALWRRWIETRIPRHDRIRLHRGNIFILPTREGLFFGVLLAFMTIAAINYQNSLIFAFVFLLGSLFMVSMLHTYRNLSGLELRAGTARPAFVGEDMEFGVFIIAPRDHEAIRLSWPGSAESHADPDGGQQTLVRLYVRANRRGLLRPGWLRVETCYPVGLFRAWSQLDLDLEGIVYPRPLAGAPLPSSRQQVDEGELQGADGVDDFHSLREYQPGDTMRQLAWKSYARTGVLVTKQFAAYVDRQTWLDWDQLPGLDRETRLSRLCHWALQLSRRQDEFGLRLPGLVIEPGRSEAHRESVLRALALFEVAV